jgi:N-acetyl-anhydromuramyl-L-alanine amidase AmpD
MKTDYAAAIPVPSPNYWKGRSGFDIKYIVMHGTAGDAQPSLNWLTNPASTASVHYLVDRQGTVYQLVNEANAAWGNGIPEQGSVFLGGPNPNYFTISIEHERNVDNTSPITPEQQAASTALVANIRRRHGNLPLIPHSAISPLSRVHCPGPGFPMDAIDRASLYVPPAPHHDDGVRRFELLVAERLRPVPVLASPRYGATLPAGTIVAAVKPKARLPAETTNWIYTRTGGDVRGYLLKKNLRAHKG